jgi:hypothetical protein
MGGPSQSEQSQQTGSWSNLNSLFNTASTAAGNLGTQGQGALDQVTSYFKNVLGSRQGAAASVAPAANAATEGADAAKKQESAMGSGRTGGGVAGDQQRQDTTRSNIDTLIAGGQSQAAQGLTAIGSGDVNAMMSALGIGTTASGTVGSQTTSDINTQREAAAQMWSSLISGAGKIGAVVATGGAAAPILAAP